MFLKFSIEYVFFHAKLRKIIFSPGVASFWVFGKPLCHVFSPISCTFFFLFPYLWRIKTLIHQRKWSQPANGIWFTCLLVKINNTCICTSPENREKRGDVNRQMIPWKRPQFGTLPRLNSGRTELRTPTTLTTPDWVDDTRLH